MSNKILETALREKAGLDKRFTPEQQELLKSKFLNAFFAVISDCKAYENRDLSADKLEEIKTHLEEGKLDFTNYNLASMQNDVEYVAQGSPHLYQVIEAIADSINQYHVPYACKGYFDTIKDCSQGLILNHELAPCFLGNSFEQVYAYAIYQ